MTPVYNTDKRFIEKTFNLLRGSKDFTPLEVNAVDYEDKVLEIKVLCCTTKKQVTVDFFWWEDYVVKMYVIGKIQGALQQNMRQSKKLNYATCIPAQWLNEEEQQGKENLPSKSRIQRIDLE